MCVCVCVCVCFNIYQFILKDIIKDADEEVHRASCGRVPCGRASVSMELGCATLSVCGCVHQSGSPTALFVEKTILPGLNGFGNFV